MEYKPSCPLKNSSQKGASGRLPLVRNKKAIFGTRLGGPWWILGANDALHSNSSSDMLCMRLTGSGVSKEKVRGGFRELEGCTGSGVSEEKLEKVSDNWKDTGRDRRYGFETMPKVNAKMKMRQLEMI